MLDTPVNLSLIFSLGFVGVDLDFGLLGPGEGLEDESYNARQHALKGKD